MSERLHESHEHLKPREHETEHIKRPEVSVEHEEHRQHEELLKAERAVEHQAKSKHETHLEKDSHKHEQPVYVNQELKRIALERTLARVRHHLSKPSKTLSKIVHQPTVQAVSEVGAKTVARPSGLLAGSLCAFIGSSVIFYLSKHYGFEYNYLLFFVFFVSGFFIGLIIEIVLRLFKRRRVSV